MANDQILTKPAMDALLAVGGKSFTTRATVVAVKLPTDLVLDIPSQDENGSVIHPTVAVPGSYLVRAGSDYSVVPGDAFDAYYKKYKPRAPREKKAAKATL
jgi:hypothetical protein